MNEKEFQSILDAGEGEHVEFKEKPAQLDREMVAFANSSGGSIFLGITDKKEIKGMKITNKMKSQIQDSANNCDPPIRIGFQELGNILIIEVSEGDDRPYRCSSGFYRRIGPNSQKMTRNEIKELFQSEGKIRFDELLDPEFEYPGDFDDGKLSRYLELGDLSRSKLTERTLKSLKVIETDEEAIRFNNAGVLFFARDPQWFVSWSVFTVVLFKDERGADIIDRKEVKGSLFEIVDQVMDFVKLYSKVAYRFTGKPQRENIYEYPFEAVREAVINSVMHKDYYERGHNNILKFFPDRIQIENIWIKPRNFVLGETVFRRNRIIADLFERIDFGEKLGSGMERMEEICDVENAPYPEIRFTDTHFYIVFKPTHEYLKMAGKEADEETPQETVEETVDKTGVKTRVKTRGKIIRLMNENPEITIVQLADILGITAKGVEWQIVKLKSEGRIRRIGPRKGGQWKIIEDDE